jgi:hypothetical protein
MALFSPISPPKNYSLADRNFDQEYRELKDAYLKKQRQLPGRTVSKAKFECSI